jgi:hypothetical protein
MMCPQVRVKSRIQEAYGAAVRGASWPMLRKNGV